MVKKIIVILLCIFCFSSCQKESDDSREIYRRLMKSAVVDYDTAWKGQYLEDGKFSDYILAYSVRDKHIKLTVINHPTADSVEEEYTKELQVVDNGKNWTTLAPIGIKNIEEYKSVNGLKFIVISALTGELRSLDGQFVVAMKRIK